MNRAKPSSPNPSQTPTDNETQTLQVDSKSWRKLWKPKQEESSTERSSLSGARTGKPGPLKGGAIFLGFLCFFLSGAAGIAHWQTGLLGVAKGPSYGKSTLLTNPGFQTFYYEAGQEIWIKYTTEIKEGVFKISIWTSDKLFSWTMIDKVFEYEVAQSETKEITWVFPQSGYYRIVFGSENEEMPDLNGSVDRRYFAQYGIKRGTSRFPTDPAGSLEGEDEKSGDMR